MRTKSDARSVPSLKKYKGKTSYWYKFVHAKVAEEFGGGLTFCNEFCVRDEYKPVAVYHATSPDRSKGHKDYFLIQTTAEGGLVRGMTPTEIEPYRYQKGLWCHGCDEVIYSIMRHNYQQCKCRSVGVDGGKDYFKYTWSKHADFDTVEIDLLTDNVTIFKDKRTKAK